MYPLGFLWGPKQRPLAADQNDRFGLPSKPRRANWPASTIPAFHLGALRECPERARPMPL
jgi:hypothetical protein